jgi:hypothetical protein
MGSASFLSSLQASAKQFAMDHTKTDMAQQHFAFTGQSQKSKLKDATEHQVSP